MDVDDRPVLCRAVQEQLRSPACRKIVVDFRCGDLRPAAVTAALRIHQLSSACQVPCTLVSEDRVTLRRVLADNGPADRPSHG
ncbi:hypothetical protein [Streptacidiphilus rugosus]|uniref:hypothetical protein n=1 Tax=Streptacidiphilus rugosus TaxID=405783 RepID=UPI0012FA0B2E|nr:hypothetical protein [Streptacidiphilus rugosus]